VEIWARHQHVAQIGCLEGGDGRLFLGDEKAAKRGHIGLNGSLIDGKRIAGIDELLGLAGLWRDVVPDDADADVMKIIIRKNVASRFCSVRA
jgi:hypothetical protein